MVCRNKTFIADRLEFNSVPITDLISLEGHKVAIPPKNKVCLAMNTSEGDFFANRLEFISVGLWLSFFLWRPLSWYYQWYHAHILYIL